MVDVVFARMAVENAVAELQCDCVFAGLQVIVDVRSFAAEEDAMQTRIQLRTRRSACVAQTRQCLDKIYKIVLKICPKSYLLILPSFAGHPD